MEGKGARSGMVPVRSLYCVCSTTGESTASSSDGMLVAGDVPRLELLVISSTITISECSTTSNSICECGDPVSVLGDSTNDESILFCSVTSLSD